MHQLKDQKVTGLKNSIGHEVGRYAAAINVGFSP